MPYLYPSPQITGPAFEDEKLRRCDEGESGLLHPDHQHHLLHPDHQHHLPGDPHLHLPGDHHLLHHQEQLLGHHLEDQEGEVPYRCHPSSSSI